MQVAWVPHTGPAGEGLDLIKKRTSMFSWGDLEAVRAIAVWDVTWW